MKCYSTSLKYEIEFDCKTRRSKLNAQKLVYVAKDTNLVTQVRNASHLAGVNMSVLRARMRRL